LISPDILFFQDKRRLLIQHRFLIDIMCAQAYMSGTA
jgi:hypothetical protein